ncbi:MAG: LamG domain-containing protein, partial [Pedobacter sp.]
MKRLLLYLSCFLLVGGSGTALQSCETWEMPSEQTLSINQGLVAYLPFDKGSLKDSIRLDEKRITQTITWGDTLEPAFVKGFSDTQGASNLAIYFNGQYPYPSRKGNFLSLEDTASLQFNNQFSISLWIKPDITKLTEPYAAMQIFHKSNYDGTGNESFSSMIRRVSTNVGSTMVNSTLMVLSNVKMDDPESLSNVSRCTLAGPGWQRATLTLNPSVIVNDSWHHIVFTYTGKYVSIYTDGNLSDAFELDGTKIQSCPGGDLRFGMGDIKSSSYFKGAMDEIRIYNRQLNDNEVKSLF